MADALEKSSAPSHLAFHEHPVDKWGRLTIQVICGVLLLLMVGFTNYTVIMRYVFLNPPFWADTITLFANIWLVFMAVAISIRNRNQIAMTALYDYMPKGWGFGFELLWSFCTFLFGLFLAYYGWVAAVDTPGDFWELNQLPKSYPLMILPVAGVLITLSSLSILIEDAVRLARKDYTVVGGFGADGPNAGAG